MLPVSKTLLASVSLLLSFCVFPDCVIASESGSINLLKMKDWCFSAVDWHNDPHLFVKEVGQGEKTIVRLHGGWGAEHAGLVDLMRRVGRKQRIASRLPEQAFLGAMTNRVLKQDRG